MRVRAIMVFLVLLLAPTLGLTATPTRAEAIREPIIVCVREPCGPQLPELPGLPDLP